MFFVWDKDGNFPAFFAKYEEATKTVESWVSWICFSLVFFFADYAILVANHHPKTTFVRSCLELFRSIERQNPSKGHQEGGSALSLSVDFLFGWFYYPSINHHLIPFSYTYYYLIVVLIGCFLLLLHLSSTHMNILRIYQSISKFLKMI